MAPLASHIPVGSSGQLKLEVSNPAKYTYQVSMDWPTSPGAATFKTYTVSTRELAAAESAGGLVIMSPPLTQPGQYCAHVTMTDFTTDGGIQYPYQSCFKVRRGCRPRLGWGLVKVLRSHGLQNHCHKAPQGPGSTKSA